jgi:hypothetical protein
MVQLRSIANGFWTAGTDVAPLRVVVAGDATAPDAECALTVERLLARWDFVESSILTFLRALPADGLIQLDGARGAFQVSDCGFAGEVYFHSLYLTDVARPQNAVVTFATGFPDGYVVFDLTIEHEDLSNLRAYCT